jgi:hypothetical protein
VGTRREPSVARNTCEQERDSKRHNKNGSPYWPNKQCTPNSGDEEQHLDRDPDRTWRRNPRGRLVTRSIEQRGQTHQNNHDERHRHHDPTASATAQGPATHATTSMPKRVADEAIVSYGLTCFASAGTEDAVMTEITIWHPYRRPHRSGHPLKNVRTE